MNKFIFAFVALCVAVAYAGNPDYSIYQGADYAPYADGAQYAPGPYQAYTGGSRYVISAPYAPGAAAASSSSASAAVSVASGSPPYVSAHYSASVYPAAAPSAYPAGSRSAY